METVVSTLPDDELADWADWSETKPNLEQYRTVTGGHGHRNYFDEHTRSRADQRGRANSEQ